MNENEKHAPSIVVEADIEEMCRNRSEEDQFFIRRMTRPEVLGSKIATEKLAQAWTLTVQALDAASPIRVMGPTEEP